MYKPFITIIHNASKSLSFELIEIAEHTCLIDFKMCYRYVLGVYNERTEVMKMYDTEMVTLQPKVLGNNKYHYLLNDHLFYVMEDKIDHNS